MSGMLLCRGRKVQIPYYAEDLGIHLYSGEELSYYIYHNAALLTEDFLGERLYRFIGQELGLENLEAKLRRWSDMAGFSELLLVILQDIHYYEGKELEHFRDSMAQLDRLTPANRIRRKAEYLLKNRRYSGAVAQYDRLLNSEYSELKEKEFLGSLWQGRGIACARQYRYQEAAENLTRAQKYCPKTENLRMLYQISCLDSGVPMDEELLVKVSAEERNLWDNQLVQVRAQSRFIGKGQDASEWMDKDKIRRASGLQNLANSWKTEYRRNQDG